jgi:outer membrane immunogenic protein
VTTAGAASTRGLVTGVTFGGGLEWALSRNWSLRGEYLHVDFGKVTINTPTVPTSLVNDFNSVGTTADLTAQIARAGLNYRF